MKQMTEMSKSAIRALNYTPLLPDGSHKCCKCSTPLVKSNWTEGMRLHHHYICRECVALKNHAYFQLHPETPEKSAARYYAHAAERAVQRKNHRELLKLEAMTFYSRGLPHCAKCGFSDMNGLTIDHVGGGGEKHRRENGYSAGYRTCLWLKQHGFPEGFQVLCMNCNYLARVEKRRLEPYSTNKISVRLRLRAYKMKQMVMAHYSEGLMECASCGCKDARVLSVDHIEGHGKEHRRTEARPFYDWIVRNGYPEGFQILCMNCQLIKQREQHENKSHIHDRRWYV